MRLEGVHPRRWSNIRILFEDRDHGIISGQYDGNDRRVIGLRYNGEGCELGYPNARGYPTFFHFFPIPTLELSLLSALERLVAEDGELRNKYGQAIREELAVFERQHREDIEHHVRSQVEAEFQEEIARRVQEQLRKRLGGAS
jgi:hypothetical protein